MPPLKLDKHLDSDKLSLLLTCEAVSEHTQLQSGYGRHLGYFEHEPLAILLRTLAFWVSRSAHRDTPASS